MGDYIITSLPLREAPPGASCFFFQWSKILKWFWILRTRSSLSWLCFWYSSRIEPFGNILGGWARNWDPVFNEALTVACLPIFSLRSVSLLLLCCMTSSSGPAPVSCGTCRIAECKHYSPPAALPRSAEPSRMPPRRNSLLQSCGTLFLRSL